jgi:hypothetical protein
MKRVWSPYRSQYIEQLNANMNAIAYKEVFKLIKENKMWLGWGSANMFGLPDGTITSRAIELTRWFTNLDYNKTL